MPGKASLLAKKYYAHPRNAFWRIIEQLFGVDATLGYEERCARLTGHGVAVWDVLKACTRSSSLDSDIVESSIVPNDFQDFFDGHPKIRAIYFNGAKAETTYRRHVLAELLGPAAKIPALRLPSTSPANASLTFEDKLEAWQTISQRRSNPHEGP